MKTTPRSKHARLAAAILGVDAVVLQNRAQYWGSLVNLQAAEPLARVRSRW